MQSDSMADDFGRKVMAAASIGWRLHAGLVTLNSVGAFKDARKNNAPIPRVLGARRSPPNPESLGTNLAISAGGDQVAA
jgi:hypothetical protein